MKNAPCKTEEEEVEKEKKRSESWLKAVLREENVQIHFEPVYHVKIILSYLREEGRLVANHPLQ